MTLFVWRINSCLLVMSMGCSRTNYFGPSWIRYGVHANNSVLGRKGTENYWEEPPRGRAKWGDASNNCCIYQRGLWCGGETTSRGLKFEPRCGENLVRSIYTRHWRAQKPKHGLQLRHPKEPNSNKLTMCQDSNRGL